MPLYEQKKNPLTTDEICKFYKETTKRQLLPEKLRKTYLPELLKSGILEEKRDESDKRRNYYSPLLIGDNNIQSIPELLCHFRIFTSISKGIVIFVDEIFVVQPLYISTVVLQNPQPNEYLYCGNPKYINPLYNIDVVNVGRIAQIW